MSFLSKYYKPWSLPWILQRSILLIKQRKLPRISLNTLVVDYKFTRQVRKNLRNHNMNNRSDAFPPDFWYFNFNRFELPEIVTCKDYPESELSALNHYFDHVYVINLERRADRRLEMIQKLTRLNIRAELFPAVDGNTKENQDEFQDYLNKPIDPENAHELEIRLKRKAIYSPGAWATLKTYKKLILDAENRGFKTILSLQDDAVFSSEFENLFKQAIVMIPDQWKLIYLGASQHSWIQGEDLYYPEIKPKTAGSISYYHALNTDGAFAIGIHKSSFYFLKKEIEKMNCSFDSGPLRSTSRHYRDECFVIDPNLIIADVRESDIRISRKQIEFARTVRWNLSGYDFPFKKDLVSVIMPAYNAEKTIEKSIRSILLQNYKELEIIVVDDGSSDRTPTIVQKLTRADSRVKLLRQDSNQGRYVAQNKGLRISEGKYIAIQSTDDISLNTRIETQLIPLVLGQAEFTLACIFRSRCTLDELDINDQKEMIRKVVDRQGGSEAGLNEYYDRPVIGFTTSIFKQSLFEELGLFWENRFGSDAEFLERVLYHKAGKLLTKNDSTILNYLMKTKSIPGIYERIDTVQLISPAINTQNITNTYSNKQKDDFENTWRRRLIGEYEYIYPKFAK